MTREEAIKNITEIKKCEAGVYAEALEMAITALSQEPQSEWERDHEVLKAYADGQESMKPCEDAISRQAAIDAIENEQKKIMRSDWAIDQAKFSAMSEIRELIADLPSVGTEKTGHWIEQDIHNCHTNFKCSECGYVHSFTHLYGRPRADYTYCPNCSCRMMEVEE